MTPVSDIRSHSAPILACIIAGTHSGCGKTTITLGLMAALSRRGLVVQPYKAGPDFIDPGHHTAATGRPSINLDGWMCGPHGVREAYARGLHAFRPRHLPGGVAGYPPITQPSDLPRQPRGDSGHLAPDDAWRHIWCALSQTPDSRTPLAYPYGSPSPAALQRTPASDTTAGMTPETARCHTAPDIALIEGVMGLHDGASATATTGSTAELALLLDLPVVLVIRARGMARSTAAMVMGYAALEPGLRIAGVICNEVGGPGHREMLRDALTHHCPDIPLLGMVPRDTSLETPSRHLGLALAGERNEATFLAGLAGTMEKHVDIDTLLAAIAPAHAGTDAHAVPQDSDQIPLTPAPFRPVAAERMSSASGAHRLAASAPVASTPTITVASRVPVAVARDEAFSFLYAENLALLSEAGMDVRFFSPVADAALPDGVRGVLLPGGYPELHARRLAANHAMRAALRDFAATGRPVNGECGGYMYLMDMLETPEGAFPMCGCLPLRCRMDARLRALGYREATLLGDATFGDAGTTLRGHEYHYSHIVEPPDADAGLTPLWQVRDRRGRDLGTEGWQHGTITGSYIHLHLASNNAVARALVAACAQDPPCRHDCNPASPLTR